MIFFQIIATLFACFMAYVVRVHQRKLKLTITEASFWYSLWIIFIIVTLFPQLLKNVVGLLHFARVFDLLVVIALMILTTIVVMSHFTQRENSKKLEEYVRKCAIRDAKERKK